MSRASIRRQIRKYENLRSKAEEKLRELEQQLEELCAFKSRYQIGENDFDININNRKIRSENVNSMSQHIKAGKSYYAGMNEDLTGVKHENLLHNVECTKDSINQVIVWLEEEIEKVKQKIAEYDDKISELYHALSREDD